MRKTFVIAGAALLGAAAAFGPSGCRQNAANQNASSGTENAPGGTMGAGANGAASNYDVNTGTMTAPATGQLPAGR